MSLTSTFGQIVSRRPARNVSTFTFILTFAYVAGAIVVWPDRYFQILGQSAVAGIVPLVWMTIVVVSLIAVVENRQRPVGGLVGLIRQRGLAGTLILISFVVGVSAYTTYKIAIPEIVPFYADGFLAWIGKTLHGDYPWRLAHSVLPDWLSPFLVTLYGNVWMSLWFSAVIAAAFIADRRLATHYLVSMALALIVCGTILAAALSSVGPIYYDQFYGGERFADLLDTLKSGAAFAPVLSAANYLFSSHQHAIADAGTGISAAPSVHVAIATLNAFFFTRINRWLGLVAWAFAAAILFGSVYLGWHYVVDGYISVAVVSLIWWFAGKSSQQAAAQPDAELTNPSLANAAA